MSKAELIEKIAKTADVSKAAAERAHDVVTDAIKASLAAGAPFTLHGIGTFKVAHRAARQGRNPKTGEAVSIPEKKAVHLVVSGTLKAAVNAA
jgi:DNA-binding protein HU-beta